MYSPYTFPAHTKPFNELIPAQNVDTQVLLIADDRFISPAYEKFHCAALSPIPEWNYSTRYLREFVSYNDRPAFYNTDGLLSFVTSENTVEPIILFDYDENHFDAEQQLSYVTPVEAKKMAHRVNPNRIVSQAAKKVDPAKIPARLRTFLHRAFGY